MGGFRLDMAQLDTSHS